MPYRTKHVVPPHSQTQSQLALIATFPRLRALAWAQDVLFAARGYSVLSAKIQNGDAKIEWEQVASFRPPLWRFLTSSSRWAARLVRDGFHALVVLPSGHLVGAVPGSVVTLAPGDSEFRVSLEIPRGTRPLHFCSIPGGSIFFGEYFDNPGREEVHIYASRDRGCSWSVAYTFPRGAIRHVHNIVYDRWADRLWILTGDEAAECRILRASCDLTQVDEICSGTQQSRSAALVPTEDGLYFSSDTPFELNHIYRIDRHGKIQRLADLPGSSIYGCAAGRGIFFSTMVEPSAANPDRSVCVYGSIGGAQWQRHLTWQKDYLPMGLFQYGNAFLPDGENRTDILAVSTIAVKPGDQQTSLWRVA